VAASFVWLRRFALGICAEETTFARRGFREGDAQARQRLEQIGATFLHGYHTALEEEQPEALARRLQLVESELRGFAFEGASMALALLDHLTPWKRHRWQAFLNGPGSAHIYMVHVGLGWVVARLPWLRGYLDRTLSNLHPLLRWLVVEGYGFHEGYFSWRRSVQAQTVPKRLAGYACRVFDQGLGRSLWFVEGAEVSRIATTIAAFPPARQADLWSGVGLACAYAGGVTETALQALRESARPHHPQLAQGAAFAAKARQRASNPAAHTERACQVLCGVAAEAAAGLTDRALADLPGDLRGLTPPARPPAFEIWRQRIQTHFVKAEVLTA